MIPGSFGFRPCNQRTSESSLSAGHTMGSRSDSLGAQLPPERRAGWAELLGATGSLELRLRGEKSEWKASVPRDGSRPDLEPLLAELLFQLHSDGLIDKVSGPNTTSDRRLRSSRPAAAVPGIDLDLGHIKTDFSGDEEDHVARAMTADMKAALARARGNPVRRLVNLDCYAHEDWALQMLQAVAPHVEELELDHAELKHLEVVRGMAALRKLQLVTGDIWSDAPPLPPQLEDVFIYRGSTDHIQSIQRMPRLRRLALSFSGLKRWPPVPPHHVGLQHLVIAGSCADDDDNVFALIRAHGATLEELQLSTPSLKPKESFSAECFYEDLAGRLGRCGLRSLKRLLLVRTPPIMYRRGDKLSHTKASCSTQVAAIAAALESASTLSKPQIICTVCHIKGGPK